MHRTVSRAATSDIGSRDNFVAWWATAMWAMALIYLLATVSIR